MREIIKKLAEGIWVDDICAYCWAFRDDAHKPDCLVVQAKEALRLNIDGSRKVGPIDSFVENDQVILTDRIVAGIVHSFATMLANGKTSITCGRNHNLRQLIEVVGEFIDDCEISKDIAQDMDWFLKLRKNTVVKMKFDPSTGAKITPMHPDAYRDYYGEIAWLFNPWTGKPRDPRDIGSDVFGLLMIAPGESIKAMKE